MTCDEFPKKSLTDSPYYSPKLPKLYWPWGKVETDERGLLAFDHAKFNLVWLIFPEVEDGLLNIPVELAQAIHKHFDQETRLALTKRPVEFLRYWDETDDGTWALPECMPIGYREHMEVRVLEAEARMLGMEHSSRETVFSSAAAVDLENDAEFQFKLGKRYHNGHGVVRNFEKAAECYLKAANLAACRTYSATLKSW